MGNGARVRGITVIILTTCNRFPFCIKSFFYHFGTLCKRVAPHETAEKTTMRHNDRAMSMQCASSDWHSKQYGAKH
jgi:hypothetical protein